MKQSNLVSLLLLVLFLSLGCQQKNTHETFQYKPIPENVKIEFRLAQDKPASGFHETIDLSTNKTIYLADSACLSRQDMVSYAFGHDTSMKQDNLFFQFTEEGTQKLAEVTTAHLQEPMAILINDQVVMVPVIKSEIEGGKILVTFGIISPEEIRRIKMLFGEKSAAF